MTRYTSYYSSRRIAAARRRRHGTERMLVMSDRAWWASYHRLRLASAANIASLKRELAS